MIKLKSFLLVFSLLTSVSFTSFAGNEPTEIDGTDIITYSTKLYNFLELKDLNLSKDAFTYAIKGYSKLKQKNNLKSDIISVIDFSQPSTAKRFYVIDIKNKRVLYNTYVSHGRNSGNNKTEKFSNISSSYQSSLGFFKTAETYYGKHGYSLRLDGLEKNYNSNARRRAVVIHSASYVSEDFIKRNGRLGRSHGCPALPNNLSKPIIDIIKNGTVVFAYSKNNDYLNHSTYLN